MFVSSATESSSDLEQKMKHCKDFGPNPHLPCLSLNVEPCPWDILMWHGENCYRMPVTKWPLHLRQMLIQQAHATLMACKGCLWFTSRTGESSYPLPKKLYRSCQNTDYKSLVYKHLLKDISSLFFTGFICKPVLYFIRIVTGWHLHRPTSTI